MFSIERVLDDNTLNCVLIAEIFRTNMGTHIHNILIFHLDNQLCHNYN